MEIRHLRYFVEICKHQSFARAAEASYISAQGISMAIARLEEELSQKLFERNSKKVVMTKHAEYLLPRAKQILAIADDCETYFSLASEKDYVFKVYFTLGSIEEFAGQVIAEFQREYPKAELKLMEGYDVVCDAAVENGEAELGLSTNPVDFKKFDATLLYESKHAAILRWDDPLAKRRVLSVLDLKDRPIAALRSTTKTFPIYRQACLRAGFEPEVKAFVDNINLAYYLAQAGQAVALSTTDLARRLNKPDLVAVPFDDPVFDWELYLIKRKKTELSHYANVFEKMLLEHSERLKQNTQS